jgi:hypothetical protein
MTLFEVRLESLNSRLEFRTLLVSFRAFVTRLFILDFMFWAKSFVIESVRFSSVANIGIYKLKIDNIVNAIVLANKIAFICLLVHKVTLLFLFLFFGIWQDELIVVKNKNLVNFQMRTGYSTFILSINNTIESIGRR